jgi:hypothetical protein
MFGYSKQFEDLRAAYIAAHPKAEDPLHVTKSFSEQELVRIMTEAGGREIVFRPVPKAEDLMTYYFK